MGRKLRKPVPMSRELKAEYGMYGSFAILGKSQPSFPDHQVHIYLPDADKAVLDAHLAKLALAQFGDKTYSVKSPDGTKLAATFLKWHGQYALFYVTADDLTIAVPVTSIVRMVEP